MQLPYSYAENFIFLNGSYNYQTSRVSSDCLPDLLVVIVANDLIVLPWEEDNLPGHESQHHTKCGPRQCVHRVVYRHCREPVT